VLQHDHHAREFSARNIHWIFEREQIKTIHRLSGVAETLYHSGDVEESIAIFKKVLELNPHYAKALHMLAIAEWQKGDTESSMINIAHAIAVNDQDSSIVSTWGRIKTTLA